MDKWGACPFLNFSITQASIVGENIKQWRAGLIDVLFIERAENK